MIEVIWVNLAVSPPVKCNQLSIKWLHLTFSHKFAQMAWSESFSRCLHRVGSLKAETLAAKHCLATYISVTMYTNSGGLYTSVWDYSKARLACPAPWDRKLKVILRGEAPPPPWAGSTDGLKIEERAPEDEIICHSRGGQQRTVCQERGYRGTWGGGTRAKDIA